MKKIILPVMLVLILTACGPVQKEGIVKDKPVVSLKCSQNMVEYKVEGTSMKFCYDVAWGEPKVENVKAKAGTAMIVSFEGDVAADTPTVWIESRDFMPETGEKEFKFELLNATIADQDQLKKQLKDAAGYEESRIKVRKSDVGGVRALRVEGSDRLNYFIPDAFYEHHVMVSGDLGKAEMMDNFVFDMAF